MAQWTTTYDALIALLSTYIEDNSDEYTDNVQGMVNRAEERLYKDLDVSLFDATLSTSTGSGVAYTSKPALDAPVISVFFTSTRHFCEQRSYDYVQQYGGSGVPLYFHESDTRIYWAPTPDAAYAVDVRQSDRPSKLSGSNTTNWFTDNVGEALLMAALVESERFLIAPDRVEEFEANYARLINPIRGYWRSNAARAYEPVEPTPEPQRTR